MQQPWPPSWTLWHWLVMLGVLLAGAAGGFWLSEQRNAASRQEVESALAKVEQELQAEQRSQDAAELQAYFEQMTHLLLERDLRASGVASKAQRLLGTSGADSEVQRLARARTLAIVANSDAEANRSITRFLTEMDVVKGSDPVRLLSQSHLPDADLSGAFLPAADLNTSLLSSADLSGATLVSANLSGAVLRDADLRSAQLGYANLEGAVLAGADLSGADLTGAAVTDEQLDAAKSLKGATMPSGAKHD